MKKYMRVCALVLCLLTVVSLLAACGGDNGSTTTKKAQTTTRGAVTTAGGTVTTAGTGTGTVTTAGNGDDYRYDEDGFVLDNIPDSTDFEERVFNALYWSVKPGDPTPSYDWIFPLDVSETDVIQSEIYNRNVGLEARLNCRFAPVSCYGEWNSQNDFIEKASKSNEEKTDLIVSHSAWPAALAQKEILYNLKKYDFPQIEMPWWPADVSELIQYNTMFFISDTSSPRNIWAKEVTFVDLQAVMEKGLDDPLEAVVDKKWTLDLMYEYTTAFHDQAITSTDVIFYGIAVDDLSRMDAFYYGAGGAATKNNSRGIAQLAYASNNDVQRATSLLDKVIRIMDTEEAHLCKNTDLTPLYNREAVFMVCTLGFILQTNDDYPYAAMPMPMYDEAQGGYRTVSNDNYDSMCVPVGAADPAASALIIEAIASANYREIAPVFYEDKLKSRYSRSQLGMDVYDIILSSSYLDFGIASLMQVPLPDSGVRNCFTATDTKPTCSNNFATWVQAANGNRAAATKLADQLTVYKKYSA